ncbi:VOC family protein [Pontibacter indicus]|uniref:VOC domain-containing protein n=1 Tax=Pontibacter indicus TaxID=1317125 RepID=A0A1R3WTV5_9BACT|nr:VOC family protein [Pontibacter indicus]SIT81756.1 hypothetical protein SAMN05444128_1016 [Pontibacter indicus]
MAQNFNVVGWFEIPVTDMPRAIRFYETLFGYTLHYQTMGDEEMAWFPWTEEGPGASGSLVKHEEKYKPSVDGAVVYFSSPTGDLANELTRVEKAGGKILQDKTLIAEAIGFMALILDTEGNRIALHSRG